MWFAIVRDCPEKANDLTQSVSQLEVFRVTGGAN